MADTIRVGIIGGGGPGIAHARGYKESGGWKITGVADLIPQRRKAIMDQFNVTAEFSDAKDLLADPDIDAVSICLPNDLHAPVAVAALRAGKHVLCEKPPAMNAREARQIEAAASRANKIVLYGLQRRFGAGEQASHQAIAKGYIGNAWHARASWMRTRGIPVGTGWFNNKSRSGGGAMIDIGVHMLDLAWFLLGQPKPESVFAITQRRLSGDGESPKPEPSIDVEDSAFVLLRFEGNRSLELAAAWAFNQPPRQNGTLCRIHGDTGSVDVYTPGGSVLYRHFNAKGESKATSLKLPKTFGRAALARHFRECILGKATPIIGAREGVMLMEMLDAIYKSSETGKSVSLRQS